MTSDERRTWRRRRAYHAVYRMLSAVLVGLIVLAVVGFSTLSLMMYGDARTALAHAKVVKLALDNTSQSAYAYGRTFADPSHEGGVDADVYEKILTLGKMPGEFWLLQTEENGYGVARFLYSEGRYTVIFTDDPLTWQVVYNHELVYAQPDGGIAGHSASE